MNKYYANFNQYGTLLDVLSNKKLAEDEAKLYQEQTKKIAVTVGEKDLDSEERKLVEDHLKTHEIRDTGTPGLKKFVCIEHGELFVIEAFDLDAAKEDAKLYGGEAIRELTPKELATHNGKGGYTIGE